MIYEENLYIEDDNGEFDAIFERDEEGVYLCDELSSVDIRIEYDDEGHAEEIYSKQHLEGRYGADPYLKRIVNWEVKEWV